MASTDEVDNRQTSSWLDAFPYLVGVAIVAFSSYLVQHSCHVGTVVFAKVERGTPRFNYCFEELPTHPWLAVAAPAGLILVCGAVVIRRQRLVAWVFVGLLLLTMVVFGNHISELRSYVLFDV